MKKMALFAIIALTMVVSTTAQNKKDMKKKLLFVLTSHDELGTQGEKQDFGQKNLLLITG
jgi:hypothetical protein